jgi:hypothetical protein
MTVGAFGRNLHQNSAVNSLDPYVMVDIMRDVLKALSPALILALAAGSTLLTAGCGGFRPQVTEDDANANTRIAKAGVVSDSAQMQRLKEQKVSDAADNATETPGSKTPEIDTTKKLEFADVYVSLEDPTGMRALVPYLMKPESWTLIKCEMTSTTARHYRFQKVASNDGKSLPDVDIFRIRR